MWKKSAIPQKGTSKPLPRKILAESSWRAKYIEGLENRLARMESLLRKSGLLEGDGGQETDLGTLEKRLANQNGVVEDGKPDSVSKTGSQARRSNSPHSIHDSEDVNSPSSPAKSPDVQKSRPEGVEELSDMMCTLVTNNCGESRYVGQHTLSFYH